MQSGKPIGGRYSFDGDNRESWAGEPAAPSPPSFYVDPITLEVADLIDERFADKGVTFTEIDVSRNPAQRQVMMQRSNGGRTVPQIFIGQTHVGGCDELYTLERAGKLDPLLAA